MKSVGWKADFRVCPGRCARFASNADQRRKVTAIADTEHAAPKPVKKRRSKRDRRFDPSIHIVNGYDYTARTLADFVAPRFSDRASAAETASARQDRTALVKMDRKVEAGISIVQRMPASGAL